MAAYYCIHKWHTLACIALHCKHMCELVAFTRRCIWLHLTAFDCIWFHLISFDFIWFQECSALCMRNECVSHALTSECTWRRMRRNAPQWGAHQNAKLPHFRMVPCQNAQSWNAHKFTSYALRSACIELRMQSECTRSRMQCVQNAVRDAMHWNCIECSR